MSETPKTELGTIPKVGERGLLREEIERMISAPRSFLPCNPSPWDISQADRDTLIMVLLWETWARVHELLAVRVEDIEVERKIIHLTITKRKVHGKTSITEPRDVQFSDETRFDLVRYLDGRRKGPLFLGNEGGPLTQRAVRKMIHRFAVNGKVQAVVGFDQGGNPRYLVTPKAFREAGEAWAIIGGMDPKLAAGYAGHSERVQAESYRKYDSIRAGMALERARQSVMK